MTSALLFFSYSCDEEFLSFLFNSEPLEFNNKSVELNNNLSELNYYPFIIS